MTSSSLSSNQSVSVVPFVLYLSHPLCNRIRWWDVKETEHSNHGKEGKVVRNPVRNWLLQRHVNYSEGEACFQRKEAISKKLEIAVIRMKKVHD